jgi:hypothetical protein
MGQYFLKNKLGRPLGPGAFRGCMLHTTSLISAASGILEISLFSASEYKERPGPQGGKELADEKTRRLDGNEWRSMLQSLAESESIVHH